MESVKHKIQTAFKTLQTEFGYVNPMQAPRIEKVVISSGVRSGSDKKKIALIEDRLSKITGQKPVRKGAKISVAGFKIRQGDTVGMQITLRGRRMYDFLDKLINVALPRTKDFRGISANSVDDMGNYSFGIRENTIFPETSDEDLRDVFGMAITVVTNVKNKAETKAFLKHLGFPFKKVETKDEVVKEKKVRVRKKKEVAA